MKSLLASFGGIGAAAVGGVALAGVVLGLYLRFGYTTTAHVVWIAGTAAGLAATGYALRTLTPTRHYNQARRAR